MAKTDFQSVDEYIDTFPEDVQEELQDIRNVILEAVPEAEEVISYQLPALKFHGYIFYLSAHARHYSLSCPPPWTLFEVFKEELSPYKLSKSTIQFPKNEPVPYDLIQDMAKFRANENLEKSKK